jgi:outer membrane protein assembly factor BamB
VHCRPLSATGYPPYLADLVVSSRGFASDLTRAEHDELRRVQRPHGGVVCVGRPGRLQVEARGALAGEGRWTHQYADAGNSVCSGDTVRGPLGVLWFRDVGQPLTQRHGRGPAPLYLDGRVYSLGLDSLICVDAYNGREIWSYPLPGILRAYDGDHLMGTSGTHSPYCVSEHGVFVREPGRCLRLDCATGELLGEYPTPAGRDGTPGRWGYIACVGDRLFGSLADPDHVVTFRYVKGGDMNQQLTESKTLFAMDAGTGELSWRLEAKGSFRHNAIAIGGDRVFLIDRPQAVFDRARDQKAEGHVYGVLLALDARTGDVVWRESEEIFGTLLALSGEHRALMMSYQPTRYALASERGGRIAVFDSRTGSRLWDREVSYRSRPMLNAGTIYAEGGAWDLRGGEDRPFDLRRSYGCGILATGRNLVVYRSATLGYYDLAGERRNRNFGGIRPGCWINALPAGGMVILPEGSTGCVCSYQNRAWMVLVPDQIRPPTAEPAGGAFSKPVRVRLASDHPSALVRYTLDGSRPTGSSPVFRGQLRIDRPATLRAVAFRRGGQGDGRNVRSRVATWQYEVDPDLLQLEDAAWRGWDVEGPVSGERGDWSIGPDAVRQSSNIHRRPGSGDPSTQPHYGTMLIYERGDRWRDGTLDLQVRSDDNDGIGVAFRFRDPEHHYLFHMDSERRFRVLARRDGERYDVLASDRVAYPVGRWLDLSVELRGSKITVRIDGDEVLAAQDGRYRAGTVALHSWGSTGVQFRRVAWRR